MITTFLVEHPWLSPTALALLIVLGPPLGAWLRSRPRVAWALAGLAAVPVVALTFVPTGRRVEQTCEVAWYLTAPSRVEPLANVVLFVPIALLLAVALGRPLLAFAVASATSVAVEAVQAAVPALGRSCSTIDLYSNVVGAALGAVLGAVACWLASRVMARRSA